MSTDTNNGVGSSASNPPSSRPQVVPMVDDDSADFVKDDLADDVSLNLFVANLSSDVTDDVLLTAFHPFGRILSCKVMLDIHTGASRGFGFVLFENHDCGARAMSALHGTVIGSRQVFISVAKTSGRSGIQQTPKLYVRNVPKALSLDTLREHFCTYGNVTKISLREDATQTSAPFAQRSYLATTQVVFLEYETPEQADEAVRRSHNSRQWPHLQMEVPLLAKPAETSEMRNERRMRQQGRGSQAATATSPPERPVVPVHVPHAATAVPIPTVAPHSTTTSLVPPPPHHHHHHHHQLHQHPLTTAAPPQGYVLVQYPHLHHHHHHQLAAPAPVVTNAYGMPMPAYAPPLDPRFSVMPSYAGGYLPPPPAPPPMLSAYVSTMSPYMNYTPSAHAYYTNQQSAMLPHTGPRP